MREHDDMSAYVITLHWDLHGYNYPLELVFTVEWIEHLLLSCILFPHTLTVTALQREGWADQYGVIERSEILLLWMVGGQIL